MNIEEAIKTALDFEFKVHAVYGEALKMAEDQKGKRIFQVQPTCDN